MRRDTPQSADTRSTVLSLLWPQGMGFSAQDSADRWGERSAADLSLNALAAALCLDSRHVEGIRSILTALCDDVRVIQYRQEVLEDYLRLPDLAEGLESLLPAISQMTEARTRLYEPDQALLFRTVWRLGELEVYTDCVSKLRKLLSRVDLKSEGLIRLRDLTAEIESSPAFQSLAEEMPKLREALNQMASVTIGVNLDHELHPVEATLLSVNAKKFKGEENIMLKRLLGGHKQGEFEGVGPLHQVPYKTNTFMGPSFLIKVTDPMLNREDHLMFPLFKDLDRVLKSVVRPIAEALDAYIQLNGQFLVALEPEIEFYLGAVRLIHKMQEAGMPMCRPQIVAKEERLAELDDLYNLTLALHLHDLHKKAGLHAEIVLNNIAFNPQGRIFILTGPNRGGKTTYAQAVGQVQMLFQAGLYVPARRARLSPADGIYTHFPVEEKPQSDMGRLGEESSRLSAIFQHASRYSLILLNESLSTTSPGESLYLARDVVRALRLLGVRALYATHLHELGEVEEINQDTPGDSLVASLVAGAAYDESSPQEVRRTYKISPASPTGLSYAKDIARRYGISFEQLQQVLQKRKVV